MQKLTVAIIGAGRIGKMHAENLLYAIPQVKLKTIVEVAIDQQWANKLKVEVTNDLNKVLLDKEIKAVIIATPTPTHVALIEKCASAKKHIFCEKPIASDPQVVNKAIQAVEKAKVKLQVGFNRRFDPHYSAVKNAVSAGNIGKLHTIRIVNRDPKCPKMEFIANSGGLFLDFMVHDFDMMRFITGAEIAEVYAMGAALIIPELKQYEDIDTAIVVVKMTDGTLGTIDCTRQTNYGYDQRLEVFGSKGNITAKNVKQNNTILTTSDGVLTTRPKWSFVERYQRAFLVQLQAFFDCVLNDRQPLVGGHDAKKAVMVAVAAQNSFKNNVSIDLANFVTAQIS